MKKKAQPFERIDQLEKLWSWAERLGWIKAVSLTLLSGGMLTAIVSYAQQVPRWVILTMVFVMSSVVVFLVISVTVRGYARVKKAIVEAMTTDPLIKRVEALENQLGPRNLKPRERAALIRALSHGEKGKISINVIEGDTDARNYADAFASVLEEAGWEVWGVDAIYPSATIYHEVGITFLAATNMLQVPPSAQTLADAMGDLEIEFKYYNDYQLHRGSCKLIIGHRGVSVSS